MERRTYVTWTNDIIFSDPVCHAIPIPIPHTHSSSTVHLIIHTV